MRAAAHVWRTFAVASAINAVALSADVVRASPAEPAASTPAPVAAEVPAAATPPAPAAEGPATTTPADDDTDEDEADDDEDDMLIAAQKVAALRLALADPEDGELERLEAYLSDVVGQRSGPKLIADVSRRLDLLGRYGAPICRGEALDRERVVLSCTVRRARVLRRVIFESNDVTNIDGIATGLPLAILENELKKRVLLRPGEPIDDDDTLGRGRIARQRARIEDFLEREGYYGAQVVIDVGEPNARGEVDVTVQVRGGSFVRVRRVDVLSFGPFSQRRLQDAFGSMCLTTEGLIDGVFIGNLKSCFNRRRLSATSDAFTAELRTLGYPEGRVKVTPSFIDARASNDVDGCAWSRDQITQLTKLRLPIPPRCVDVSVEVTAGRNIVTRFHHAHGNARIVDEWPVFDGTARWVRESFLEPTSRAWQLTFANPVTTAADTEIVAFDLREQLTFEESGSVDETEARLSQDRLLNYLHSRGYPAPKTSLVYREYRDGSVAVDYTIDPGEALPLAQVRFAGNSAVSADELSEVDLAARARTLQTSGFVTYRDLDDDVVRLRDWYVAHGYSEADVQVRATRTPAGEIEVTFFIAEGKRFVVGEVILVGGDPALTPAVLRAIVHCETPGRAREGPPRDGKACAGAPLLPGELDGDVRRVQAIYAGSGYADAEAAIDIGFGPAGAVIRVAVFPFDATGDARSAPKAGNVKALRLGQVFVEGNLRTSRDVLLREMGMLDIEPGTRLNPDAIAAGVARLRRTALFSRVDAQLVGVDDTDDIAHLRVTVEERPTTTLDLSLGFSTLQFFSLRLEGRDRNLLGSMFDGSASVDLGLFIGRFSQVRNQIRWPRMLGSDLSLSYTPLALTYLDQPAGVLLQVPSSGGAQKVSAAWDKPDARRRLFTAGTSVSLDWRAENIAEIIDNKLTIGVALEARGDWLQIAGPYIAPLSLQALQSVDGVATLFFGDEAVDPASAFAVTPRIAYSSIDNPFDPKSGVGAELFVRTVPFAVTAYGVVGAQGRGYLSFFNDRLTFAGNFRMRAGVVGDSGKCALPERCEWALMQTDLLRLGGERSVRGVEENQIGVTGTLFDANLDVPTDADNNPLVGVRPGLFGASANVELRFTLVRQLFLGDLKPAIFADAGFSSDDFAFEPEDATAFFADTRYAVSVGTGIRYVLPVGPLAFDIAYSPFDRQASTLPLRYSLTLGYIF